MKLLQLAVIIAALPTAVLSQDPPPIFDLPPPPPMDRPVTDVKSEDTAGSLLDAVIATAHATDNETLTTETNDTAVIKEETIAGSNGTNATVDIVIDDSVLEGTSNISSIETIENTTDTSKNATLTDVTRSDILAVSVNETTVFDSNISSHIQSENETINDSLIIESGVVSNLEELNVTSHSENISTPLEINANASDSLVQTEPVDIQLPPIPTDSMLQNDSVVFDEPASANDTLNSTDMVITSVLESNETISENTTYIDQMNIYINDTGVTIEHTPVEHIEPGSTPGPKLDIPPVPLDLPPPPVPVDLPPPPSDKLSIDFIETSDSTTVEISEMINMLAEIGAQDNVSTPMGTTEQQTTTQEMPPGSTDAYVPETVVETTTESQPDIYATQLTFEEYTTTTSKPEVTDPAYIHAAQGEAVQFPDHPPPIFSGGGRPSVYTDPYGPHEGYFPVSEQTTTPKPAVTKEAPPPPIFVPTTRARRPSLAKIFEVTTASPKPKWPLQTPKATISGVNPRYMNVAELAAYALQMAGKKTYNQNAQGIQVFFPTEPQTTTAKTTTQIPTTIQAVDYIQEKRSNAFVEYLRKKYGINNVAPTTPYFATTTGKPAVRIIQEPKRKTFYDAQYLLSHLPETTTQKPAFKKFFDSNYLLSHLDVTKTKPVLPTLYITTEKPALPGHFFDEKYLLSHLQELQTGAGRGLPPKPVQQLSKPLPQQPISNQGQSILKEQRQGQIETRPLNLKPALNAQSFINYNVNPQHNIKIDLQPQIEKPKDKSNVQIFAQPPSSTSSLFGRLLPHVTKTASSFKPVVYGSKPYSTAKQSSGLSLRERFNRKWYHPENKKQTSATHAAVRNINIPIEKPSKITTAGRDFSLQQTNIDVQKQILKQQEMKLRQQQQILKEQQAILLRQQQERERQLQQQQRLLIQQQEQERLLRLKQEQQKQLQNQRGSLAVQSEHERLLQQRHLQQKLQDELQQTQQQVTQQQEHDRLLQLQRQMQTSRQRQTEQNVNSPRNDPFPLASRTGRSEVIQNNHINAQRKHIYQPNVQLSSIQIFKAPALLRKRRKPKEIQHSEQPTQQTHWRAPSDLRHLHAHLSVPYKLNTVVIPETTTITPVSTAPSTDVFIATLATTTVRQTTQPTIPTEPATADPNPPPIFDTKVRHTFMPMPKIEATTKGPNQSEQTVLVAGDMQKTNAHTNERCHGCVFVNDRCLLPDPVHCNFFIECVKQGNSVRAFSRECALGSFFDRKSFLCVDPKNADCPTDRCRVPGTKWYPIEGHCKHYWSCGAREGGSVFAQSECCPDMGGFVEPDGCVENPNCTDSCSSPIIMESPEGCQLRKTASPKVYFDGNANIERPCAPGTLFNERACTCVQDVSIERSEARPGGVANCTCGNETSCSCSGALQATERATSCLPMLSLPFNGGSLKDTSNTKQHIGVEGISTTIEGEAIYNGGGRLVLWRYANLMFPLVFAIKFRFYSTAPSPRHQLIFSNCDTKGGQEPSIEISLDTLFKEVVFKVNTYQGAAKRFTIIYEPNKWTAVDFIYDGERIVGSVDRRARNIFAAGGIETRPNPVGVGSCTGKDGFKGLLDDVFVYEDCIPDEMYGVFMSVLE